MATPAVLCTRCQMPLPANSPVCPTCDDVRSVEGMSADEAYNRRITWWLRASCALGAIVWYAAIRAMGRRPMLADYLEAAAITFVASIVVWGALRLKFRQSQRYLWRTALIPAYLLVGIVFVVRAASGQSGPGEAAASSALQTTGSSISITAVSRTPAERIIPLVRIASECFSQLEAHAKTAGNEVTTAGLPSMFTIKPETLVVLKTNRAKLKTLDGRLLEIDADIRKTASGLPEKLNATDAPADLKGEILSAVKESGTELVKRTREAVAHQRRLIQQTDLILAFIEPRFKRLSDKAQVTFTGKPEQVAFDKLVKQYDAFEEESTAVLRRIHQRADQSKQQLLVALTMPREQSQATAAPTKAPAAAAKTVAAPAAKPVASTKPAAAPVKTVKTAPAPAKPMATPAKPVAAPAKKPAAAPVKASAK